MATVERHLPGTPSWLDLQSPDPDKARAFYSALFGWEFFITGPETGHYSMALLNGRMVAGLGAMPPGAQYPSTWSVYFATDDIDATCAAIQQHGGQQMMGPMDVADQGRLAMCADPSGAVFGLWQPKNHQGSGLVNEPGSMAWHEVNTRESEKVRDFYAAVFGLSWQPLPDMAYYMLKKDEAVVAGVMQMDHHWPADLPAHWMNYFAVADTDAAIEKVKSLGGTLCVPAFDTPYGRMAVVGDPLGAMFSIITLQQS